MEHSGKLKIIDELNPSKNILEHEDIIKFLSEFDHTYMDRNKTNRPDYFIIDNFASHLRLDNNDLLGEKS